MRVLSQEKILGELTVSRYAIEVIKGGVSSNVGVFFFLFDLQDILRPSLNLKDAMIDVKYR